MFPRSGMKPGLIPPKGASHIKILPDEIRDLFEEIFCSMGIKYRYRSGWGIVQVV